MKKTIIAAIVCGALIVAAGAVQAQTVTNTNQQVQEPLSVKLGVFLPTNGTAREYGQSAQLSAGLDYAFAKSASENPLLESVYVDYQGGSKNSGHVQTIGGGVAVRTYLTQPAGTKQSVAPYVGAGIGYYRILFKRTDTDRDATTSSIGGKLLAGVELPQNLFLEANYQFLPSKIGINPSGVGIDAGIRF